MCHRDKDLQFQMDGVMMLMESQVPHPPVTYHTPAFFPSKREEWIPTSPTHRVKLGWNNSLKEIKWLIIRPKKRAMPASTTSQSNNAYLCGVEPCCSASVLACSALGSCCGQRGSSLAPLGQILLDTQRAGA